jgi:steroid delta-isomerase-like uncharacterized protein
MSVNDNERAGRRFFDEMIAGGQWALAAELMLPNVVMHHPSSPTPIQGRDAVVGLLTAFRAGFPDLKMRADDAFGANDRVVVRWTMSGKHDANLFGIPPTGKAVQVAGISILRFQDGKVAEDWVAEDTFGLMKQLGVIPA